MKKILRIILLGIVIFGITGCSNIKSQNQSNKRDENASQVEIKNDYINIREKRSTKSNIIGKVHKGEIYTIISSDNSANQWIEIKTANNIHGYISGRSNYVKYLESADEKKNKFKSKYQKLNWICDVSLNDIKTIKDNGNMNIQPKLFITKEGKLYQFSTDKKYSNEQNCKEVESDKKFSYFNMFPNDRDLSLIVDDNNNFYYFNENLINFSEYSQYHYDDTTTFILNHPLNYVTFAWVHIEDAGDSFYNYYVENNGIYKVLSYWKNLGTYYEEPVLLKQFENETILSVEGKVFKTDKGYYKIGTINKEKCEQYEDIECEEGILRIDDISNKYSEVEYFNGNYVIFKNDKNLYGYYAYQ